jgi:di/tripeptidase
VSGKKWPQVPTVVTHATVEVGILADKYPGTQWLSMGATCHNMHTTREHIYLADLEEFCERLERIIKNS